MRTKDETYLCDSKGRRSKPFHEKLTLPLVQSSSHILELYCGGRERQSTVKTEDI